MKSGSYCFCFPYLIEFDPESRKLVYPDVGLTRADVGASEDSKTETATLEPVTIPLEMIEGPHESYIEILHRPDRSLIAVLELLSPAKKQSPDRTEYLNKRGAILRQNVHLVELDLLLGGRRLPMKKPLPAGDYFYFEARAEERPDCRVYAWSLPRPLPRLPVPLQPGDADVMIDLGQVFRTAYDRGRFGRRLAYREPCPAPLRDEQRSWVGSVIAGGNGQQ